MEKKMRIKDRSSISPVGCIIEHIYWMFVIFINYKNLIFIPLNNYSVSKSKMIFVGCMAVASVVGSIARWRKYMTTRAVLADIMIGVGLYTVLTYKNYYKGWMKTIFLIFAVYSVICFCLTFYKKYKGKSLWQLKDKQRKSFIIKGRFFKALNATGLAMGVLMTVLLIPIVYNPVQRGDIVVADAKYSANSGFNTNYAESENSLTYNIDTISKIRTESSWRPLSTSDKLQILQAVCNCEANYWGMDFEVTIAMDDLEEHILGAYNDSERKILIDRQHLENDAPESVLETCLHEMYHVWQHSLVRLYLDSSESQRKMRVFQHCDEYISEMMNYQDGGEDYESYVRYYCQVMESDSRAYAAKAVKEYYNEIDEILAEQNQ